MSSSSVFVGAGGGCGFVAGATTPGRRVGGVGTPARIPEPAAGLGGIVALSIADTSGAMVDEGATVAGAAGAVPVAVATIPMAGSVVRTVAPGLAAGARSLSQIPTPTATPTTA